jgi:hypothetical protein
MRILQAVLLSSLVIALAGACSEGGIFERAGARTDEAVDDASDAVGDAADDLRDAVDEATEDLDDGK